MIYSQTITVSNCTKRAFSAFTLETTHTAESAQARQRQRRQLGGEFVNGWYVVRFPEWTEYQRYYEAASAAKTWSAFAP
ncbi:hypothetical protein KC887_07750 [Candidatus Kaiserbacteria bacterium]|nr:hypothetical protein [Candidatus Kaiserbacteria bacterium]